LLPPQNILHVLSVAGYFERGLAHAASLSRAKDQLPTLELHPPACNLDRRLSPPTAWPPVPFRRWTGPVGCRQSLPTQFPLSAAVGGGVPPPQVPNPSRVDAAGSNSTTACALFIPPRLTHPSGAQMPSPAPKGKGKGAKRSTAAAALPETAKKPVKKANARSTIARGAQQASRAAPTKRMVHRRQGRLPPLLLRPARAR
jgi:hypothetical protein